ncbi:hypothetical protein DFQ26_000978 [Actinomortierella ambigua]|nr:hypothetical protein DFQ26_000978 [Actinomortierella ambigua]
MCPTRFKSHCDNAPKREPSYCDKVHKHEPKLLIIDFLKRGLAISKSLLGIGAATPQEGTNNSTTSQEDGAENHDAVASKPTTGKEKLYPDIDVDKELNAGHSAMPVGTCKVGSLCGISGFHPCFLHRHCRPLQHQHL